MVWIREINVRGPAGSVDVNDPQVMAAVRDAINGLLSSENVMRAYPEEPVARTTLAQIPFRWTYKTLSAPVPEMVTQNVEGTWSSQGARRGDLPVLSEEGLLSENQIPDSIARVSDIPENPPRQIVRRVVSRELPVLAARIAAARVDAEPVALVFAGSSTTFYAPGYVTPLVGQLQDAFPVDRPSTVQASISAEFTEITEPGIHGYNAAQGSTTSADFLTDAECDRIAALRPALVHIMVGANDLAGGISPDVFRANLESRLAYLESVLTAPCQIVLVHQYQRYDRDDYAYEWTLYGQALAEIAAADDKRAFYDVDSRYRPIGIPGPDPLGLMLDDLIHQNPRGYAYMTDLFAAFYFAI